MLKSRDVILKDLTPAMLLLKDLTPAMLLAEGVKARFIEGGIEAYKAAGGKPAKK